MGHPGERLNDRVINALAGVGTGFADTVNRQIAQFRVARHHRFGAETQALNGAGPEVLGEHIGTLD